MPDTRGHRGADPRDAECVRPGEPAGPARRRLGPLLAAGARLCAGLRPEAGRRSLEARPNGSGWPSAVRPARTRTAPVGRPAGHGGRTSPAGTSGSMASTSSPRSKSYLGGGVVIHCRDGTYRDLAGVHGTYRRVAETTPALESSRPCSRGLGVGRGPLAVRSPGLQQRPDSRPRAARSLASGAARLVGRAGRRPRPGPQGTTEIVATADSAILDAGPRWFNLARDVIESIGGLEQGPRPVGG